MLQTVASVVAVAHACAARVSRTVHKFRAATAQPVFEAEVQTAQVNWGTVGYFSLMITVRMAGLILVMLQSDDGQSQRGSLRMLPGLANAGSGCVGVLDPPFECLRKLQDNIMLNNTLSQLSEGCSSCCCCWGCVATAASWLCTRVHSL